MNKSTLVTGPILLSLLCMTLIVASFSWYQAAAGEITVSGESSVSVTVSKPDDLYIAVANTWNKTTNVGSTGKTITTIAKEDYATASTKEAFSKINLNNSVVKYTNQTLAVQSGSGAYVAFSNPSIPLLVPGAELTTSNIDTGFTSCVWGTTSLSALHFRFYIKNLYSSTQDRTLQITPSTGVNLAVMETTDAETPVVSFFTSAYKYETVSAGELSSLTTVNMTNNSRWTLDTNTYSLSLSSMPSERIYTYDIYLWQDGYKSTSPATRFGSTSDTNYPTVNLSKTVTLVID